MTLSRRDLLKRSLAAGAGLWLPAGLTACGSARESIYDIVVYGGTSAGIIAAVHAARSGRSVVLIEPSSHLGGLTTGGLGHTDSGRQDTIGGMSKEFYRRIRAYYEDENRWVHESREEYIDHWHRPSRRHLQPDDDAMWGFEPHAAAFVYRQMLREANVPVVLEERLVLRRSGVEKTQDRIAAIRMESGNVHRGRMFIDATYEGDLLAMAGVSYHVGRESTATYDEALNGIQKARSENHIFVERVNPYLDPANPSRGLLPGIHGEDPGLDGEGDHRVQAYCYRMCLTDVPANRIPIERPAGYSELDHELLLRNFEAGDMRMPWLPGMMPNRKTDTNNRWAVSLNKIGANYEYPHGDYTTRGAILTEHRHYQQGFLWTLANHPRVPKEIRAEARDWGLAADEFVDHGHWPPQIYVREARRMVGEYVTTEQDCRRMRVAGDSVGMGSYNMDSHNVQRYVTEEGFAQNEGNIEQSPGGPYAISYRSIIPRRSECTNLLVPCAVSSSHIAFGSIRMEPVFMLLGHSAAAAAALALSGNDVVQDVSYPELRKRLVEEGQFLDVDLDRWPARPYAPEANAG
jgi:hypothetical protein